MKNFFASAILIPVLISVNVFASEGTDAAERILEKAEKSEKATVAVLPVTDLMAVRVINQKTLYGEIVYTVQKNGKFTVIDRSTIKHILKEKELTMTGLVAGSDTGVGQLAGADYILSTIVEQGVVEMKLVRTSDGVVEAFTFYQVSTDRQYGHELAPKDIKISTGWISGQAYQAYFDTKLKFGYYPVEVRGRKFNGTSQYNGTYMINVKGIPWYTHHGVSENFFRQKSQQYRTEGFRLKYKSTFRDENGFLRYNAIWIK